MSAITADSEFALPEGIGVARPVFIVGAPRSGASLLTLSLGQHAKLVPVPETNWFERLAAGVQHAYTAGIVPRETSQLDASGLDVDAFSALFGDAIDRMMREQLDAAGATPGQRWIDGSSQLTQQIFPLLRLFPNAKLIHVYREAGEVVASLTNPQNRRLYKTRFQQLRPADAATAWMDAVTACVDAERAFGSATVMRIRRQDLVTAPETTLRRCLAFIDEPFDPACVRAFRPLDRGDGEFEPAPALAVHDQRVDVPLAVDLMSRTLFEETAPAYPADELRRLRMELAFGEQMEREARLLAKAGKSAAKASNGRTGAKPVATSWRVSLRGLMDKVWDR